MSLPNKTDLATIAKNVESGLKAFNKKKAEFKALKTEAAKIVISDIADKATIKAAGILRKKLKASRCEVAKQSKELRQPLTNLAFMISEKEKELIAIIEPSEKELQRQELWVATEQDKIDQAEKEKQSAMINDRINRLAAFGFSVDTETLASLDDETFNAVLAEAQEQHQKQSGTKAAAVTDSDLHSLINDIMNDEKNKINSDDKMLMVDLNQTFQSTMNVNPVLFEERKRLVMYAAKIAEFMHLHSPVMSTPEGNDIIATANELLKKVNFMLMDAVEQI